MARSLYTEPLAPSLWAATAPKAIDTEAVDGEVETEVLVVGAGFSGLSTAYHVADRKKTVVVEAGEIGQGASGRTTGHVIPSLKADPDEIVAAFGPEKGEATVEVMKGSANLVFDLIRKHDMEQAGEQSGWVQSAHTPGRIKVIEKRFEQWARRGQDVSLLSKTELSDLLGTDVWHGGWTDPSGGILNPMAFARGLAKAAAEKGVRVFTGSPVLGFEQVGDRWRAKTPNGSVLADRVVIATNAYTDDLWPGLKRSVVPVKIYQVATKPLTDKLRQSVIPGRQAISDTHGDLFHLRYTEENRLMSGAAFVLPFDGEDRLREHHQKRLAWMYPQLGDIEFEYFWSGHVGMSKDRLPHLHVLAPGMFTWIGCNGRAVAFGTAMGPVMADLACDADPADQPLPVSDPMPFAMHAFGNLGARIALWNIRRQDAKEV